MTAFATKGLLAMLEDMYRCPKCGGSDLEIATGGITTSNGRGESVTRAKTFALPAKPCTCPPTETNAAVEGAAAREEAGSTHELSTPSPQPCSTEMGVWDDHNEPTDEMVIWDDGREIPMSSLMLQDRKTVERGPDGRLHGGYPF